MRIAVSGSIATDHLMTFGGKFTDTLIAEKLDKISVSFLVGNLEIRRGGVAGNIAYGLGCLGLKPLLVGCVGPDFADYRNWLEEHGVDTSGVRTSATRQTARFTATNDESGNQIASFYPGAMSEDGEIDITSLAAANGDRAGADRGRRSRARCSSTRPTAARRASRSRPTSRSRWPSSTATRCGR